jgi:hypothetical protein
MVWRAFFEREMGISAFEKLKKFKAPVLVSDPAATVCL